MNSRTRFLIGGGVLVASLMGLLYLQLTFANGLWMLFRANVGFWFVLTLFLSLCGAIWYVVDRNQSYSYHNSYSRSRSDETPSKTLPLWPLILGAVILFALGIFLLFYASYAKAAAFNAHNTVVKPGEAAQFETYDTRAPWVVADQQISDNTTINGSAYNTTYVPDKNMFSAFVERKGWLKGYGQVVWAKIGDTGQATTESCSFTDAADKKLGGYFTHNLERAIMRQDFGIKIDAGDAYAYCNDEGEPIIVVPFKKFEGFWFPHEVPAGVALYNGVSGEVTLKHDVKEGEIPGPVYPLSLAKKALESTSAADGFWAYVMSSTGYQGYGGENSSEYTLHRADNSGSAYVTPLTMIGRGKAITAVGEQTASSFKAGKLNSYKIAVLPQPRQGDSAVEDRVKADYPDLSWASGIEIFEIAPTSPDEWTATVGLNKAISYRLTIKADSSSCLYSVKGVKLRCTGEDVASPKPDVPKSEDPLDLASLSDAEILQLQEAVQDEIGKRLQEEQK